MLTGGCEEGLMLIGCAGDHRTALVGASCVIKLLGAAGVQRPFAVKVSPLIRPDVSCDFLVFHV